MDHGTPHTDTPVAEGTIATGYLSSHHGVLHIQTLIAAKDPDGKDIRVETPKEFADFDIRAISVIRGDRTSTWDVEIHRRSDGAILRDLVTSATLADGRKLDTWLATHEVSYGEPTTGPVLGRFRPGTRIMRYLIAQRPSPALIVQQLGYHDDLGMFLTLKGAILPGEVEFDTTVPYLPAGALNPAGAAPFTFGFAAGGLLEVRDVLAETLTFHDEEATALFASWAAMSLIQSALMSYVDHFPVFAVEAPSGTGKTTGALGMLAELITGYNLGESQSTLAVLRDLVASTWSGFIHTDDVNDPKTLFEMLRLSTAKGTKPKKSGENWSTNALIQLTGSMYITGEYLGMNAEKALLDRVVKIGLSSPVDRRSQRPGREHMSQARDMKEVQRRYRREWGGLAALSATVISEVLLYTERLCDLVDDLRPATGRAGDKFAVLLAGARMVDHLLGEPDAWDGEGMTSFRVRAWVGHQVDDSSFDGDNKLTLRVIPEVYGLGLQMGDTFRGMEVKFPPVGFAPIAKWGGEERLFFRAPELSKVWEAWKGTAHVDQRTESRTALEQQARAAGFTPSYGLKLHGVNQRVWYATAEVTEAMRSRLDR